LAPVREKILIAEGDLSLRLQLQELLASADYDVSLVETADEAFHQVRTGGIDLLVLAADPAEPHYSAALPESNPAQGSRTRVVLLSRASAEDRAHSLDLGINDVIAAPSIPAEILARIRAQLRTKRELRDLQEKMRISEESREVAQTAFQALAVTEKMTRDAFNLERALKIGVGALFALALVVGGIFLLFSRRADKESRRAYSVIARLERGVLTQQELLSSTQQARQELTDLEKTQAAPLPAIQTPASARKASPSMLQSPESVIRTYAPSVCLLHVSVGFLDKNSGRPLRYGGIGPEGPYKDSDGNTVYTLEGRGPEVRSDFFGTGFIVGDNKILTNHHVAQPWWENEELMHATQQGLKPVVATMAAYFPDTARGLHVEILEISKDADLALLTGNISELKRSILKLDPGKTGAISGQPLISLGYATGLSAILARASEDTVQDIVKVTGGDAKGVIEELARRNLIRPLVTQGHIGDVLTDRIVYDAQTTSGGSGGPLINQEGQVVGVTYAVVKGFGGSNFGVPIRYAEPLLKPQPSQ
jgi:DNA-binding response OmpR family regulator/S1-C subfamily serine protease